MNKKLFETNEQPCEAFLVSLHQLANIEKAERDCITTNIHFVSYKYRVHRYAPEYGKFVYRFIVFTREPWKEPAYNFLRGIIEDELKKDDLQEYSHLFGAYGIDLIEDKTRKNSEQTLLLACQLEAEIESIYKATRQLLKKTKDPKNCYASFCNEVNKLFALSTFRPFILNEQGEPHDVLTYHEEQNELGYFAPLNDCFRARDTFRKIDKLFTLLQQDANEREFELIFED